MVSAPLPSPLGWRWGWAELELALGTGGGAGHRQGARSCVYHAPSEPGRAAQHLFSIKRQGFRGLGSADLHGIGPTTVAGLHQQEQGEEGSGAPPC